MAEAWFYVAHGQSTGPIDREALRRLATTGTVGAQTLVWHEGMTHWAPAMSIPGLLPIATPRPTPPPVVPGGQAGQGLIRNLGAKLSNLTQLPQIEDVPIMDILFGGLKTQPGAPDVEEAFVAGTRTTTPRLSELATGWPQARVFWRILLGALATYFLLHLGWTQFHNPNRIPAMIVVGAFVVPLSVIIFFFEMNTPRNVSVYQVAKMLLLGGALGIVANALAGQIVTGAGTGGLIASLLTGVAEETAKAAALLLVVYQVRYRWQLNGLLFGAAVGAGFAGFESAGYAFKVVWQNPGVSLFPIVDEVVDSLTMRALLSPGGHVIWTAMVASAMWQVKGNKPFSLIQLGHGLFVRRWLAAVVLHGLWDSALVVSLFGRVLSPQACYYAQYIALSLAGWYIIFAILKQALAEVAHARVTEITTRGLKPFDGGATEVMP